MPVIEDNRALLGAIDLAVDACLAVTLVLAVVHDLKSRRIYDWITGPAFLAGLALGTAWGHFVPGMGADAGFIYAFAGALPGAVLFGIPALFGAMGMGDAKLLAATGALLGFPSSVGALLAVTVAGGVQGVGAVLLRTPAGRRLAPRLGFKGSDAPDFLRTVPYGLAIAAGTGLFRLWQRLG